MLPMKIRHVTENDLDACYAVESVCYTSDAATREKIQKRIELFPDGKNIVIFSLAVLPEFRGTGISKKLMSKFIEVSKALKKEKILLICKSELIPYYKKYGLFYGGKSKSTHGGFEWHEMYLPRDV